MTGSGESVGCSLPDKAVYITHEGRVYPCCYGPGRFSESLGDLSVQDALEVWQEGFLSLRERMAAGDVPEGCRDCVLAKYNRWGEPGAL